MNGKPRDAIGSDLGAGRPTLSPTADVLALRVARLLSQREAETLWNRLEYLAVRSPAHGQWLAAPDRYLADFDPAVVATIVAFLEGKLRRLLKRARARGWEVDS